MSRNVLFLLVVQEYHEHGGNFRPSRGKSEISEVPSRGGSGGGD